MIFGNLMVLIGLGFQDLVHFPYTELMDKKVFQVQLILQVVENVQLHGLIQKIIFIFLEERVVILGVLVKIYMNKVCSFIHN